MAYNQQYYDPSVQQAYNERMMQVYQQYPQYAQQPQYPQYNQNQQNSPQSVQQRAVSTQSEYLSGRAVTGIDEVRAVSADPMGNIGVYTDVGNKRIYTKQINTDGIAVLNTYILDETPPPAPPEPKEYVEKSEMSPLFERINLLTNEIETLKGALNNGAAVTSSNQNGKGITKSDANVSAAAE